PNPGSFPDLGLSSYPEHPGSKILLSRTSWFKNPLIPNIHTVWINYLSFCFSFHCCENDLSAIFGSSRWLPQAFLKNLRIKKFLVFPPKKSMIFLFWIAQVNILQPFF